MRKNDFALFNRPQLVALGV